MSTTCVTLWPGTDVPCQLYKGHTGPHSLTIQWTDRELGPCPFCHARTGEPCRVLSTGDDRIAAIPHTHRFYSDQPGCECGLPACPNPHPRFTTALVLPGDPAPDDSDHADCEGRHVDGFLCTRPRGHDEPHVATGFTIVAAVWTSGYRHSPGTCPGECGPTRGAAECPRDWYSDRAALSHRPR